MKMSGEKQGRERRRLTKLARKEASGEVPEGTTRNSFISWVANAERGNTYFQVKRMKAHFERVVSDGNSTRTDAQSGT